jgi:hypothetical protein
MSNDPSAEAGSVDQFRTEFAPVLRSYNAMETTKRRHFDYLSMLENKKKKFNLAATGAEESTLQNLLRDHNDEVQEFKTLSQQLKNGNPLAHEALFQYIGQLNSALAPVNTSTGH